MAFNLIIILIGSLLFLFIGMSLLQQHKENVEHENRNALAKQRAIIDEAELVLSNLSSINCGSNITAIIYSRIIDALNESQKITPTTANSRSIDELTIKVDSLKKQSSQSASVDSFKLPDSDKQVLSLVQSLKRLKAILRSEHSRGRLDSQVYIAEDQRIDVIQLKINIDILFARAKNYYNLTQYGTAKQYIGKALSTLSSIRGQSPAMDELVKSKANEARDIIAQIDEAQKERLAIEEPPPPPEKTEVPLTDEEIFKRKRVTWQ